MLSHNNRAKTPDWVIERLDKKGVSGPLSRPDQSFVQEKLVPRRGRASDDDYTKAPSNLARGHLAPSEDFNINENLMRETFILSNAVPQVDDRFNASIWKRLEEEVRDAAKARGKVDVITGPVRAKGNSRSRTITKAENACGHEIVLASPTDELICEARNKKTVSSCPTGVTVPIAVYKIVYDRSGGGAAYAFVMPNRDHDSHTGNAALTYLEGFRTPVAVIENLTGMKFFLNLKGEKRKRVVQRCAPGTLWRTEP